MTVCYRDGGGCVVEEMEFDQYEQRSITFCGGEAYFTVVRDDGEKIDRKIPMDALLEIVY